MRTILILIASLGGIFAASVATGRTNPNILWIISEDMSHDIACYGNAAVKTPNLDRLASEGMRFTRMFTTAAVCAPSRTAIATGMYQNSIGAMHMRYPDALKPALPDGIKPIEILLKEHGYQTLGIGKDDYMFRLDQRSFEFSDIASIDPNRPFFAKVNSTYPHRPFKDDTSRRISSNAVTLPPYYPDAEPIRNDWAAYLENVQLLDKEVGKILDEFGRRGLLENTIIFFFSDNGRPFLRAKYWTYDSGIALPFIMHVPQGMVPPEGYRAGTVTDRMLSSIDITATTLALAGLKKPAYMQGKVFLGAGREPARDYVFSAIDRISGVYFKTRAVRSGKFKYIKNFNNGRSVLECTTEYGKAMLPGYNTVLILDTHNKLQGAEKSLVTPLPLEELYDLERDPDETINLAYRDDHRAVRKEMEQALMDWITEINDKGFVPDSPEIQKHFIDTRINDMERYRHQRLKGYLDIEKQLRRAGQI